MQKRKCYKMCKNTFFPFFESRLEKVYWLSKDDSAVHSVKKIKEELDRRRGSKTISKSVQGWALTLKAPHKNCSR